jgi:transposase-like protein
VDLVSALATIGARTAPLLALAPLVRAIVGHVQDHDATIHVHTADAARLLGVAPEALDLALREALRGGGLVALIGGQQAEIEALRAELSELATEADEACEALSESMKSVFAGEDAR